MDSSQNSARRPYTLDRVVRLVISLVIIGCALWLVNYLKGVLLPFCVAWLVAYLLEPFVQFNRRMLKTKGRFWATILTLFETAVFFTALGIIFVPQIIDEMHQLSGAIANYSEGHKIIEYVPDQIHDFLRRNLDLDFISQNLSEQDVETILKAMTKVFSSSLELVLALFDWVLVILYVIFIMIDYDRLARGIKYLIPPKYRKVTLGIWHDVIVSMNHYFRGQALIAVCVAVMFSIAFSIIGLPLSVLWGMCIGLMSMVPYLQLASIVPTTVLVLIVAAGGDADFWPLWWECMASYAIIQCIEDLVLTPHIMGKAMGLNPAIILLSLSIWGSLLGLVGMIIALPATTLVLAYYERYVIKRRTLQLPPREFES